MYRIYQTDNSNDMYNHNGFNTFEQSPGIGIKGWVHHHPSKKRVTFTSPELHQ